MALHPEFPKSPHTILDPDKRWFPADEELREKYDKLLPPLVDKIRREVKEWRDKNYDGACDTSKALLKWWFQTPHPMLNSADETFYFEYYFAQREAIETVIYLYEIAQVENKFDLMKYDSSGMISSGMIDETWLRFVIKMATGSGKTKVMSLMLTWSFFHRTYEVESQLARNFLVIAPNIIVLDRIRADFDGLKIFNEDPLIPENGYVGHNWQDDFQLTLHIQDEVKVTQKTGNIFLTNIHRVYQGDVSLPSYEDDDTTDYFLGNKPTGKTNESKVDLGEVVRDIDELMVLNDEAHHIHDPKLAWFKSLEDIHNKLLMKEKKLSLQIDVTATPKHNNGAIFVQTVSDYPLVEAISQNVVKHPVLPDEASRAKLQEHQSSKYTDKYRDYLHLGYEEWKKSYEEHKKLNKKAILFVMTDDTKNCDEVAEFLSSTYPELKDSVLVIHTKNNGEVAEDTKGKKADELMKLRKDSNEIDNMDSPYKVIVSVLMLKEGWDVKNVTTIVGLRAYSSKSNILPEQTLGRGLRRMYREQSELKEQVSVVGTQAFMDFVESIKNEGVKFEYKKMGEGSEAKAPMVIEVDKENAKKDLEKLDIEIPILTPRIQREWKNLSELNPSTFDNKRFEIKEYSDKEKREIVFRDITDDQISHTTELAEVVPNAQSVIGFFAQGIMKDLHLVSGYDILYGKVKEFIQLNLFKSKVDLNDLNCLRNLSEPEVSNTIKIYFKKKINELTVRDKGEAEIQDYIKVSKSRPFVVNPQQALIARRSIFNKIVGDSNFELEIASFFEDCDDIISYVKNYLAIHFKIDYCNADGEPKNYYPDFLVKVNESLVYVVETKGREDLDDIEKIKRLKVWCDDVNTNQSKTKFLPLYVKQELWDSLDTKPRNFGSFARVFEEEHLVHATKR
jgi:type III restriction enzyme